MFSVFFLVAFFFATFVFFTTRFFLAVAFFTARFVAEAFLPPTPTSHALQDHPDANHAVEFTLVVAGVRIDGGGEAGRRGEEWQLDVHVHAVPRHLHLLAEE